MSEVDCEENPALAAFNLKPEGSLTAEAGKDLITHSLSFSWPKIMF